MEIARAAGGALCALLALGCLSSTAQAASVSLDLADIVGGGDGAGTGTLGNGIRMSNGVPGTVRPPTIDGPSNVFTPVVALPLVDGVFIPDGGIGGSAVIQVSSTGLTVSGISHANGANSHDLIRNGHNEFVTSTLTFTSLIGAHASKGITFDLDALEALHGVEATSFSTLAATGNRVLTSQVGGMTFYAFVDGDLRATTTLIERNVFDPFAFGLSPDDRFLTLITSTDGFDHSDMAIWGNPIVGAEPAQQQQQIVAPEPSSLSLFGLALGAAFLGRRRRRRSAAS